MMVIQIVPTYEDAARHEAVFRRAVEVSRDRPDLQGQLLIALAGDLARQGKGDQALKVFQQLLTGKTSEVTEVFVLAARHAEELLVAQNQRDAAINMYARLFAQTVKPHIDGGYAQSAYYLLGTRLAELLTDAGQADAARKIRDKVGVGLEPVLKT
jgi:hypothetical protein